MVDNANGKPEAWLDDTSDGRSFDELFSRIDRLEATIADVTGAESGSEEFRHLRKALAAAFAVIDTMRDEFKKMRAEMDVMERKLASLHAMKARTCSHLLYRFTTTSAKNSVYPTRGESGRRP